MIAYLKSPMIESSFDSILKQEEALSDLDNSIDNWMAKLDMAENRRTRVRQKLLEHVAAALMVNLNGSSQRQEDESTPPLSPARSSVSSRAESCFSSIDRTQSTKTIKIYADTGVYSLLANIEREIEEMASPLAYHRDCVDGERAAEEDMTRLWT